MDTSLTQAESAKLKNYEYVVDSNQQAFAETGKALRSIRDGKLYRATHSTFAAYCEERFGKTRQWAHNLIKAADSKLCIGGNDDGLE